jgi:hypothetical protein
MLAIVLTVLTLGLLFFGLVVLVLSIWIAGSFCLQEGEHAGAYASHDADAGWQALNARRSQPTNRF